MTEKKRSRSQATYKQLCQVIPGGVNSPVRACLHVEQDPLVVSWGKKDLIYDIDDHAYIDYCGSWGALIHGHAEPSIVKAVQERVLLGSTFGITTAIEGELAEKIIQHMPSIELIRFVSSGTEATMSAIRLARGFTKKNLIIKFNGNYHGHADYFLINAGSGAFSLPQSSSAGIPEEFIKYTLSLPYNDIETVKKIVEEVKDELAAIIIEPIAGNIGVVPAHLEFLQTLRLLTKKNGALLIFDEVITGFRVSLGGAQELYGIKPDLTCLGKIIGGGFPAAAFGGKKEIMDYLAPLGPVYQAGTLSGNPVAMTAGLQTLKLLEHPNFYKELESKTNIITIPVKELLLKKEAPACIQQVGSMFTLFFGLKKVENGEDAKKLDNKLFGTFFRTLFEEGIYMPPMQQEAAFVSSSHEKVHLEKTRDLMLQFIKDNF